MRKSRSQWIQSCPVAEISGRPVEVDVGDGEGNEGGEQEEEAEDREHQQGDLLALARAAGGGKAWGW
jgi:hypothetical protein